MKKKLCVGCPTISSKSHIFLLSQGRGARLGRFTIVRTSPLMANKKKSTISDNAASSSVSSLVAEGSVGVPVSGTYEVLVQPPPSLVHPSAGLVTVQMQDAMVQFSRSLGLPQVPTSPTLSSFTICPPSNVTVLPDSVSGAVGRRLDLGNERVQSVNLGSSNGQSEPTMG